MRRHLIIYIAVALLALVGLASCQLAHQVLPSVDYTRLAQASVRLGVEVDLYDNHRFFAKAGDWVGTPYKAGGRDKKGVDAPGLSAALYKEVFSIRLTRECRHQQTEVRYVSRRDLRPGDLLFFSMPGSGRKAAHVGIYLKADRFLHADSRRGVIVSSLQEEYYSLHFLQGGRIDN